MTASLASGNEALSEGVCGAAADISTKFLKILSSYTSQYNVMGWRWYQSDEKEKKTEVITKEQGNGSISDMVQGTESEGF